MKAEIWDADKRGAIRGEALQERGRLKQVDETLGSPGTLAQRITVLEGLLDE